MEPDELAFMNALRGTGPPPRLRPNLGGTAASDEDLPFLAEIVYRIAFKRDYAASFKLKHSNPFRALIRCRKALAELAVPYRDQEVIQVAQVTAYPRHMAILAICDRVDAYGNGLGLYPCLITGYECVDLPRSLKLKRDFPENGWYTRGP